MSDFRLDARLEADSFFIKDLSFSQLRLMKNALVPWFILVPRQSLTEFHCLARDDQLVLLEEINLISGFIENAFQPDKINTAMIGNIVRQLHVHIVARYENDFCWPAVVWGQTQHKAYQADALEQIRQQVKQYLV